MFAQYQIPTNINTAIYAKYIFVHLFVLSLQNLLVYSNVICSAYSDQ